LTTGRLESQRLLVPMVMDLLPSAQQALVGRTAELERLGFEVEPFGSATIKVTSVPALLSIEDSAKACLLLPRISRASTAAPRCRTRFSALRRPRPAMRR
jgi:DNA mismatch repair enzyme (predicted ATPase)